MTIYRMTREEWAAIAEPVQAWFDGLCEPNPGGVACAGFAIKVNRWEMSWGVDESGRALVGRGAGMTNNVAEYQAALMALREIYRSGWRGAVVLRGDSQLVVKQFNGEYGCGAPLLIPLLARLRKAAECFSLLTLEWVPREQNELADRESRRAYVQATGHEPPVRERVKR